ncbi:phosphoribosyl-ATP pyrophosphohydrolase [Pelagibacterium sp.]|uniref:phosphoribosyl-ATP pyrophosphohydrolase n=1 Tax=Pelagibacterium sp. TaxID=1967288 RepID=UPI003A90D21F
MRPDSDAARAQIAALTQAVGQVSETYAVRCDIDRDRDWAALKLSEETGELVAAYLKTTGRGRREGVAEDELRQGLEDEAADVMAMLLIFADQNGIDLAAALERKWFRYLR